jgi:transcriptional regulator with XRE-family HTH domain
VAGTRTSDVHAKAVGRELAHARREAGLTQQQLAQRLGVGRSYIARVESGTDNLTIGQLAHLAKALGAQLRITFPIPKRAKVTLDG